MPNDNNHLPNILLNPTTLRYFLQALRVGLLINNSRFYFFNMIAIFLKPLILRARRARKIKGFRKIAKVLIASVILMTMVSPIKQLLEAGSPPAPQTLGRYLPAPTVANIPARSNQTLR